MFCLKIKTCKCTKGKHIKLYHSFERKLKSYRVSVEITEITTSNMPLATLLNTICVSHPGFIFQIFIAHCISTHYSSLALVCAMRLRLAAHKIPGLLAFGLNQI